MVGLEAPAAPASAPERGRTGLEFDMADATERWLPIPGYEGLYEVSDQGQVRSLDHRDSRSTRAFKGRVLKQRPAGPGPVYLSVCLSKAGHVRQFRVHRLVAAAFIPNPNADDLEVCHNDGNPANNQLANLRWDTRSANHRDKRRHRTDHYGSKTHCINGHEFTPENTYTHVTRQGWHTRACRQCARDRRQRRRLARVLGSLPENVLE